MPCTKQIDAKPEGTLLCTVQKGETWSFTAKGRWRDWWVPCGPDGYRNFLADLFSIRPRAAAPFFCLIGEVRRPGETEGRWLERFPIGTGCVHTFEHAGELILYANDAPNFYGNNEGSIEVQAQRGGLMPAPIEPASGFVGLWQSTRSLYEKTLGIPLIALLALGACCILAFTDQGADLLRIAAKQTFATSPADGMRLIAFGGFLLYLAIQLWFWPRLVIESNYGRYRKAWRPHFLLSWGPRILGAAPFGLVIWALFQSGEPNITFIAILFALLCLFVIGLYVRHDGLDLFRSWRRKRMHEPAPPKRLDMEAQRRHDVPRRPFGLVWVILTIAVSIIALVAATLDPVHLGRTLGPPAVVFLGLSCLMPLIICLIQFGAALRLPFVPLAIVWIVLCSLWSDNHDVGARRFAATLPASTADAPVQPDLDKAYGYWKAAQPKDKPLTMVLIASEGGASRAGYWTAQVLGQLHAQSGGLLAQRTFAISSVSGGSVGAVGYVSVLRDNPQLPAPDLRGLIAVVAARDALSPTLAAALFPDLLQRVIPFPFLPDRAQALEQSWEAAWRERCKDDKSYCNDPHFLGRPFLELAPTDKLWRPLLFVGGASEESGRRILTSTAKFTTAQIDADEFHTIANADVPISTAIHNGARFPWISPAGTVSVTDGAPQHIVDGGYFDTSGTGVLQELARYIQAGPAKNDQLSVVFVFIGYNEATLVSQPDKVAAQNVVAPVAPKANESTGEAAKAKKYPLSSWLNETLAPFRALLQSRPAHSAHLMRELKLAVEGSSDNPVDPFMAVQKPGYSYIPVIVCDKVRDGKVVMRLPLDWTLSQETRDFMQDVADPNGKEECGPDAARSARQAIQRIVNLVEQGLPGPDGDGKQLSKM